MFFLTDGKMEQPGGQPRSHGSTDSLFTFPNLRLFFEGDRLDVTSSFSLEPLFRLRLLCDSVHVSEFMRSLTGKRFDA